MQRIFKTNKYRILLAVLINLLLAYFVNKGLNFPLIPLLWLLAILILVLPYPLKFQKNKILKQLKVNRNEILAVLGLCLLLVIVTVANYDQDRFHQDDLITGYFSIGHNFSGLSFFHPVPSDPTDWVCQFPSIFFVLQQFILNLTGITNLGVKLSVIPYNLVIVVYLYLIGKSLFKNKKVAFFGSIFYIFFGISLYFTTLGLHFISSTAIYTVAIYYCIKYYQKPSLKLAIILGICAAFSMLFYVSSYLVPFFIVGIIVSKYISLRERTFFLYLGIVIVLFFAILLPFITYSVKTNNWYFLQRIQQVNLVDGAWSEYKTNGSSNLQDTINLYSKNLDVSFRSLYTKDIGGQGGYTFGGLAFFDNLTIIYLLVALPIVFSRPKHNFLIIYLFLTIVATFIAGMVMTIPPPPFHRMTLVFPSIAILLSSILKFVDELFGGKKFIIGIYLLILLPFCIANLNYFQQAKKYEIVNPQAELISYIKVNFPNRHLYMAGYPSLALGKFCPFYNNCYSKSVLLDDPIVILNQAEKIKQENAIIYILSYSTEKDKFDAAFPDYKVVELHSDQAIYYK